MRVGIYAHHHGRGHVTRAAAILARVEAEATLFSSAEPPPLSSAVAFVRLAPDAPRDAADRVAPPPLHYAPVGHAGLRDRMASIAAWAARGPAVLVSDVSAEVAAFGRLLSLPVVAVRQHGTRWDAGHSLAYRLARQLLAPYPASLAEPDAPAWIRAKTAYVGGFSRFDGRQRPAVRSATVTVLGGGGDGPRSSAAAWTPGDIAEAARATPAWRWTLVGTDTPSKAPPNVVGTGWLADPFPVLASAEVVVTHGGHNAVMEASAAGRPLVVVPARRPFDEQAHKAAALARIGAATVRAAWPRAAAWPALLERVREADTAALRALCDGEGADRAAALLDDMACTAACDYTASRNGRAVVLR